MLHIKIQKDTINAISHDLSTSFCTTVVSFKKDRSALRIPSGSQKILYKNVYFLPEVQYPKYLFIMQYISLITISIQVTVFLNGLSKANVFINHY